MSKVVLNDLQNLTNKVTAVNTINNNNQRLEDAIDNTLSRDGTGPNEMEASLDMNNFPIYNLPKATSPTEPIRKSEFDQLEIAGDVTALLEAVEDAEAAALSAVDAAAEAEAAAIIAQQAAEDAQSVSSILTTYATRSAAMAATISVATNYVDTKGYSAAYDEGGGHYQRVVSEPTHAGKFQSADGAWWELFGEVAYPKQFGAALNGSTNDSTAIQDWLNFVSLKGITGAGQKGVAAIPTATLSIGSNCLIDGRNVFEIKRTTDTNAYLVNFSGVSKTTMTRCIINTSAGFAGSGSHTIVNGSKAFTVPAGLTGLVATHFVQITSTVGPSNYMIAQITSYVGTTLTVNATTSVGTGTYTDWRIDVYPDSGGNPGNVGVALSICNDVTFENNRITGRFYHGLENRQGTSVRILNNKVVGYVNRGISNTSYTGGDSDTLIEGNILDGSVYAQYGISCAAVGGAGSSRLRVVNNSLNNSIFQGIAISGAMFDSVVANNNVWLGNGNSVGSCILIQQADGVFPVGTVVSDNTMTFGLNGILVVDTSDIAITGNKTSFCATGVNWLSGGEGTIVGNAVRFPSIMGISTGPSTTVISITGNRAGSYSIGGSGHGTGGNI